MYKTGNDPHKPNIYILDFFPYPSGDGLSVGHCRNYVPTCVSARFHRMKGYNTSVHQQPWPQYDPELAAEREVTIVVQVNGKVRDRLLLPPGVDEEELRKTAVNRPAVQRHIHGKPVRRIVVVPGKLVNIVV